ncbi:MAG: hypothetical protein H0X31_24470, partial [Nostocaceae cyanobacterium]|nr:hypothetical protein [Nostocaceae cyanobacterium]
MIPDLYMGGTDLDHMMSVQYLFPSKVKFEEEASLSLQAAIKLDNEAAILVKDKSYSNNWQEAKSKW